MEKEKFLKDALLLLKDCHLCDLKAFNNGWQPKEMHDFEIVQPSLALTGCTLKDVEAFVEHELTRRKIFADDDFVLGDLVKYPFQVMFTDFVKSWFPVSGKEVWGVVLGSEVLHLKDGPDNVNWFEGGMYCCSVRLSGRCCTMGSSDFWFKAFHGHSAAKADLNVLDPFLCSLGGDPLTGNYWVAKESISFGGRQSEDMTRVVEFRQSGSFAMLPAFKKQRRPNLKARAVLHYV